MYNVKSTTYFIHPTLYKKKALSAKFGDHAGKSSVTHYY